MNAVAAGARPLVVFRADGGAAIGAGHVMRTLALASVFRDGGWSIGFAATAETFDSIDALRGWPLDRLMLQQNMREEPQALRRQWPEGADILVIDHYGRDATLERACRGWARRIVAIDDLADRQHEVDVLVDVANRPEAYHTLIPNTCELLTGANYAIVNETFRTARARALDRRRGTATERVLVSFGQIDAQNATQRALAALAAAGFDGEIDIVLGHAAPHLGAVRAIGLRTHIHVDAGNMPTLMTRADLAIGAGGVTALERCCLGLPSVLLAAADNQRGIVAMLKGAGAAIDAGDVDSGTETRLTEAFLALFTDAPRRTAMARAGADLIDGLGAARIVLAAVGPVSTKSGSAVRLRPATAADESWLLGLQSQPETRRYSNDPSPPTADGHREWLTRTLADPSRLLMIAIVDDISVGMLRLDKQSQSERINIAVDSSCYRRGIGAAIIALAGRLRPGCVLDAEILPGNKASRALFAAAGYRQMGDRLFRREPL